jgi:hypothetical protein
MLNVVFFIVMLSAIMLSVIMLSAIMLNATILNVIMLNIMATLFYMGLTSAEGHELEHFKGTADNILVCAMYIYHAHHVLKSCRYLSLSPRLSMCML